MIKKRKNTKPVIDLQNPQGNTFFLLAQANEYCRQLKKTKEETQAIVDEMKSGDYENLIQVFDKYFGNYVDLVR